MDRWPGWRLQCTRLGGINEVIDLPRRVVLIDPADDEPMDWAIAHSLAHLELGHQFHWGPYSPQFELDADDLARLWLGEIPFTTK